MSERNECPACADELGSTVDEVITHLAGHDDEAAELIANAVSEQSLLLILHDVVSAAVRAGTPFGELPGWAQRRVHGEVYAEALTLAAAG